MTRTPETETFGMLAARFDVSEAKRIVADGRPATPVLTASVEPVLDFLGCWPDRSAALPDEALDVPLIFATTAEGRLQIIDGLHRVHAAATRGREWLSYTTLTREESVRIQFGEAIL